MNEPYLTIVSALIVGIFLLLYIINRVSDKVENEI